MFVKIESGKVWIKLWKRYENEGPLNYFEKTLTYEFENSNKVNILGAKSKVIMKKPIEIESFLTELRKELSWIDKNSKSNHFVYLDQIVLCYQNRANNSHAHSTVNDWMLNWINQ